MCAKPFYYISWRPPHTISYDIYSGVWPYAESSVIETRPITATGLANLLQDLLLTLLCVTVGIEPYLIHPQ